MAKLRLYVGSLHAFSHLHPDAPAGGNIHMHFPFMLLATSIQGAAVDAKQMAFERWPKEEFWYGHNAAIASVPGDIHAPIKQAYIDGQMDMSAEGEEGQCFPFDDGR
jgi:hypothetical protein